MPLEPNKKLFVTYDDFHRQCLELAGKVKNSGVQFDYIVAPSRGGLLPGIIASHHLGIRLFPIVFSTRDHADRVEYCNIEDDLRDGKQILFIDDINDTGLTIQEFLDSVCSRNDNYDNVVVATVYERTSSKINSQYSQVLLDDETWVVFPFEPEN